MPRLDEVHDSAHPVGTHPAWRESHYFACHDPDADAGFTTRLVVRPHDAALTATATLWLPDGTLATTHGVVSGPMIAPGAVRGPGLFLERLLPLRIWRLTIDALADVHEPGVRRPSRRAYIKATATFHALTPALGVDGQIRHDATPQAIGAAQTLGNGHFEQAGIWAGAVTVNDITHVIRDAPGHRTRTWGPHLVGTDGPMMWRRFSLNMSDDLHIGGAKIQTRAGEVNRGWVWHDAEHHSITDLQINTIVAADTLTPRIVHLNVLDSAGLVHMAKGEVLRALPPATTSNPGAVICETIARWHCNGRVGYGVAEYMHQLGPNSQPIVPIN